MAWRSRERTHIRRVAPQAARVRQILTEERGPLPLTQLLKLAHVSRTVVERLVRQGHRAAVGRAVAIGESVLEADFTPPSNVLNEDQQRAVEEIRGWIDAANAFTAGLLYGVTGSGKTEVYLRAVEAALARRTAPRWCWCRRSP